MEAFESSQPADPLQHGWVLKKGNCVPLKYCRECLPENFRFLEGRDEQQQSENDINADIDIDTDENDTDESDTDESDDEL